MSHWDIRSIGIEADGFLDLRKGQIIKCRLCINGGDHTPIRGFIIGHSTDTVDIVYNLHLLFVIKGEPFCVLKREFELQGISAVDLAGNDDIKGVFQHRLPRIVRIQDYRPCKTETLIGSLWNVVELDVCDLWCFAGVRRGQRNAEADIFLIRRLQLAAGADGLPSGPVH